MPTISEFRTILYNWVNDNNPLTADKVIFANQNGPEPTNTFIKINPNLSNDNFGAYDEIQNQTDQAGNTGLLEIYKIRNIGVSINIFSTENIPTTDAAQIISDLRDSLYLPSVYENFRALDIGLVSITTVRDLTGIENEIFIQRFNFDIVFQICNLVIDDVGYFDKVQLKNGTLIIC